MMRSLYSGISGLRNHQTRMDVIGNNIANVNTAGYKTSRVIFQDIFSQNLTGGMASQQNIGGTNPNQVGLGIRLSSIDVLHTYSSFQRTDKETDLMINGDGFFIVRQFDETGTTIENEYYTRAGNFDIDSDGYLVNSQGYFVMGYLMPLTDPGAPAGETPATPAITFSLDGYAVGATIPANTFPGVGEAIVLTENTTITVGEATIDLTGMSDGDDLSGTYTYASATPASPIVPPTYDQDKANRGTTLEKIQLRIIHDEADRTLDYPLTGISIGENGDVSVMIGAEKVVIATIAIAMFSNAAGLDKAGNSLYRQSAASGPVLETEAYLDGAGKIDAGGLEMSNVDLANEFTDMIVTQRGFQANSRIITVSDTMLEELVNLKR